MDTLLSEYWYIWPTDYWMHPLSEVVIAGEDMPWELLPELPWHSAPGAMTTEEVRTRVARLC